MSTSQVSQVLLYISIRCTLQKLANNMNIYMLYIRYVPLYSACELYN